MAFLPQIYYVLPRAVSCSLGNLILTLVLGTGEVAELVDMCAQKKCPISLNCKAESG